MEIETIAWIGHNLDVWYISNARIDHVSISFVIRQNSASFRVLQQNKTQIWLINICLCQWRFISSAKNRWICRINPEFYFFDFGVSLFFNFWADFAFRTVLAGSVVTQLHSVIPGASLSSRKNIYALWIVIGAFPSVFRAFWAIICSERARA